jgi:CheY-like chemotaxis protein
MERQVHQLTRLIDDLLDVSRITRGRLELRRHEMNLIEALQSAVEGSMPLIESAEVKLHVDVPGKPVVIFADRSRLAQVFTNLLNNAARYSNPQGNIWLRVQAGKYAVEISVKDDGVGIAPENLSQIFDMFVQVEHGHDQHGLGLGLTLVKELVGLHGGSVEARSDGLGKGSEFLIRLPFLDLPAPVSKAVAKEHQPKNARKILVVDDNIDAAETMALLLSTMGHEAKAAHEGKTGLKLAEEYRPEIILLDIGLPGLNGYEVVQKIKSTEWGKRIKVVAVTGWGQEEDKRRAAEAGFDLHLTKPVNPAEIEKILAS